MEQEFREYITEIENILEKKLPDESIEILRKAYYLAKEAHNGQMRASGEPFFEHPKAVSKILAELKMDVESIASALLHDVVEDCDVPIEKITNEFGPEISRIVDGVTKISNLKLNEKLNKVDMKSLEKIETIRKMLLAMSNDIRVIIVKLADRLHNMRTLQYVPYKKQVIKSQETLKIYAPIAHRLGIHKIKAELEDLSFKYLYPEAYEDLKRKLEERVSNVHDRMEEYKTTIKEQLEKHNIKATLQGRTKHLYSIWEKMLRKNKSFEDIYDFIALRIITESPTACYAALGVVHSVWRPVPGRIKDYIAVPKSNGYRSIHTTVITNKGETLEIQIRDWEMHEESEYGLAAHWAYKQGVDAKKMYFVKRLMDLHKEIAQSAFNMSEIEEELQAHEVFVFTPKGEILHLPYGATPIDFAYAIHTNVGNHFAGAKVNGRIVPISYELQNGDIVEIIVNRNSSGPSIDWLKYAKSSRTKHKIKRYYRLKNEKNLEEKGRDKIREIAKDLDMSIDNLIHEIRNNEIFCEKHKIKNEEELYIRLGFGDLNPREIYKLFEKKEEPRIEEKKEEVHHITYKRKGVGVIVDGQEGIDVYFAKCCNPVLGDDIIGIVSRRGIGIHRRNCMNIREVPPNRVIKVSWVTEDAENTKFVTHLLIEMENKSVLDDIRRKIKNEKANIEMYETTRKTDRIDLKMRLAVKDVQHLMRVLTAIKNIKGVYSVRRS
ncbi:(p)ppGpp synthetase [Marinitoga sp. 1135]|uniref:(P)ppGpp synthetase, RelA/SpoT family n=1 Tax=Marinitoga piezophila (strain DSM 14283 / JCM 11233 / KA3) TaxID=443254 RepID=H2J330_MARPK|nr:MULTISPECIES: bifunctional (p)ppGpp synthetase/guanosine-3',5'-bis(diphosphate) 3'-pyrophosphohydrolase [Marinitoga]AEX84548.1 (p)ppGpp synthetase, RelA/SpoT family [Marinitoga piezophila KA3]NUU94847.1 (p)ppGpp synthetase [Marinitoga sp. 1135]